MLAVQTVCNFFIPSGSGQAYVTMPIMSPLATLTDVPQQTAVLAYQFGDGFTNMIVPTSALVMGTLALGKIPYGAWVRFVGPLLIKLFALADRVPDPHDPHRRRGRVQPASGPVTEGDRGAAALAVTRARAHRCVARDRRPPGGPHARLPRRDARAQPRAQPDRGARARRRRGAAPARQPGVGLFGLEVTLPERVLDLGSGNGFPGVAVAVLYPHRRPSSLLERTAKKATRDSSSSSQQSRASKTAASLHMDAAQVPALRAGRWSTTSTW